MDQFCITSCGEKSWKFLILDLQFFRCVRYAPTPNPMLPEASQVRIHHYSPFYPLHSPHRHRTVSDGRRRAYRPAGEPTSPWNTLKTSKSRTQYGHLWNTLWGTNERWAKSCEWGHHFCLCLTQHQKCSSKVLYGAQTSCHLAWAHSLSWAHPNKQSAPLPHRHRSGPRSRPWLCLCYAEVQSQHAGGEHIKATLEHFQRHVVTVHAPVNDLKPQGANRFLTGSWGLQPLLQEITAGAFLKPIHRNKNVPM